MEGEGVSEAEVNPATGTSASWDAAPMEDVEKAQKYYWLRLGSEVLLAPSAELPQASFEMQVSGSSPLSSRMIPVFGCQTPSAQPPSSPSLPGQVPPPVPPM